MNKQLITPSTREFIEEARHTSGYKLLDFLHGYIYGRWTYQYIGIGKGDHPIARKYRKFKTKLDTLKSRLPIKEKPSAYDNSFADGYHGKVLPLESARQLVTVNEEIRLTNLETIIPYPKARDIILKNPDHIIALECPCRTAKPNPCVPLDVCLIVGEPFASFVHEHHSAKSRWITPQEATGILEAESRRGHVSHAFFKDAMLGRFYAICNCCACCCGAIRSHENGNPMLASSGYIAKADHLMCQACGECLDICQFGALSLPYDYVEIDQIICMGCGVCVENCNQGALELVLEPGRGTPLEIKALMDQVPDPILQRQT